MIGKKYLLSGLLLITNLVLFGQDVSMSNLRATSDGKITFDYQIAPGHSTRELYTVKIYTSADDFLEPLGIELKDIPSGQTQNVSFAGANHLPSFSGALKIKLKAEASLYPVQITSSTPKIKVGDSLAINWKDKNNNGPYDIILVQEGRRTTIARSISGTSYSGAVPAELVKGKYELLVLPNRDQRLISDQAQLTIASRIGIGIKVLGGLVLGGVGILATGGPGPTTDTSLPGPPPVPDN